jgi:hypothetical protein
MRNLWLVLLTVLVGACAPGAAPQPHGDETTAIQEAVFRYQFGHNASSRQQSADYYCLGVKDRKDPPQELMERFVCHLPVVVPVSECGADVEFGVSRGSASGRGLIFTVGDIKWVSATEVEVAGGYYEGGLSASGNVYRLKRVEGGWKVIEDRMGWIS